MKRHVDLITKILRHAEADCTENALEVSDVFDGCTARQVHDHVKLCEEAGFLRAWPQKLDHKLRCIMEQVTKPVEGQNDGQETAAALGGLQVSDCAGSA